MICVEVVCFLADFQLHFPCRVILAFLFINTDFATFLLENSRIWVSCFSLVSSDLVCYTNCEYYPSQYSHIVSPPLGQLPRKLSTFFWCSQCQEILDSLCVLFFFFFNLSTEIQICVLMGKHLKKSILIFFLSVFSHKMSTMVMLQYWRAVS